MWDLTIHPPKETQRPRWHTGPGTGSDTICNSPNTRLQILSALEALPKAGILHLTALKRVYKGKVSTPHIWKASFSSPTDVGYYNPPP